MPSKDEIKDVLLPHVMNKHGLKSSKELAKDKIAQNDLNEQVYQILNIIGLEAGKFRYWNNIDLKQDKKVLRRKVNDFKTIRERLRNSIESGQRDIRRNKQQFENSRLSDEQVLNLSKTRLQRLEELSKMLAFLNAEIAQMNSLSKLKSSYIEAQEEYPNFQRFCLVLRFVALYGDFSKIGFQDLAKRRLTKSMGVGTMAGFVVDCMSLADITSPGFDDLKKYINAAKGSLGNGDYSIFCKDL